MTLFERVFGGNDAVYGLTEAAVDAAIAANGEEKAVSFPDTAYALPCYYAVTGVKVTNLKEMKEALGVVKSLMTRENQLNDVFNCLDELCAECSCNTGHKYIIQLIFSCHQRFYHAKSLFHLF